jgi:hypothetical protein
MISEVLLLLIGGVVTFAFTLILKRISKHKPRLVWMAPRPILLPNVGLAALQVTIFNDGDAPALNIRAIVWFDKEERFESVHIEPSEAALEYSCPSTNPLEVRLPQLPTGASVSLSCFVRSVEIPNPHISIVGDEDVVGNIYTPKRFNKMERIINRVNVAGAGFMLLVTLILTVWATFVIHERADVLAEMSIADLYFANHDLDSAQRVYNGISPPWYMPKMGVIYVRQAAIAAAQGRNAVAISILKEVPHNQWDDLRMFLFDAVFDTLRNEPEFQKFMAEIKTFTH